MGVNNKSWDIGFRREIGDESNPTYAIVIGGTSNALHIIDPLNAGTDFNVSADATPTLYIHGSATAPTEYIKQWTDETDAHYDVVGANLDIDVPTGGSVSIQVNNTDEYEFSAANMSFLGNTLGSLGNATFVSGRTILGTSLVIDIPGTGVRFSNAASWNAIGTGTVTTGVIGPAAVGSVSVKEWLIVRAQAGTATYYIPCYAA